MFTALIPLVGWAVLDYRGKCQHLKLFIFDVCPMISKKNQFKVYFAAF
jgi:hypothetical protein